MFVISIFHPSEKSIRTLKFIHDIYCKYIYLNFELILTINIQSTSDMRDVSGSRQDKARQAGTALYGSIHNNQAVAPRYENKLHLLSRHCGFIITEYMSNSNFWKQGLSEKARKNTLAPLPSSFKRFGNRIWILNTLIYKCSQFKSLFMGNIRDLHRVTYCKSRFDVYHCRIYVRSSYIRY